VLKGADKHSEDALKIKQFLKAERSELLISTLGLITKAKQACNLV
jgi:hypothetical protein